MYPLTGPNWNIPISVILSYVVLSIEDIGAEIEEPFQVLPIRQYTEGKSQHEWKWGADLGNKNTVYVPFCIFIHATNERTFL